MEEPQKQIAITIPADAKPSFTNATQTTVTDDSVVVQFAYLRPQAETGQLVAEVVMSPKHAIEFSKSLDATLKKHFTRHLPES
jgi:hypothetical protein